jgi:N-acetylmuramoyl-L-alanine amidase
VRLVISSGHGLHIRGASGYLDEVDEARREVEELARNLRAVGHDVTTFHDDTSYDQSTNLHTIVNFHNAQGVHEYDISCHFNAYQTTSKPMGCEVLYYSQAELAKKVSQAIARSGGFLDRGPKKRTDLYFLNNTKYPAVLLENCFVDSSHDAELWRDGFTTICKAIAEALGGAEVPDLPQPVPPSDALFQAVGPCSWFGGPNDTGVSSNEGLAFVYELDDAPHLFLSKQPAGTTGLARRLDPSVFYVACRWDYDTTAKGMLRNQTYKALVRANGREFLAYPADWGPHMDTGRVADVSPGLMDALGITTDDPIEVIYPAPQEG